MRESSFLQASCKAQMLKVTVIERRLLSFTYTDQTIPALRAVSQHLEAAEQQTEAEFTQVTISGFKLIVRQHWSCMYDTSILRKKRQSQLTSRNQTRSVATDFAQHSRLEINGTVLPIEKPSHVNHEPLTSGDQSLSYGRVHFGVSNVIPLNQNSCLKSLPLIET